MLRSIYSWLVRCHPPCFRTRFGEEMLSIFDQVAGTAARVSLIADGLISVLRQRSLRSEYRQDQQTEDLAMAVSAAPAFQTLNGYRPRTSILINGAIVTAMCFCVLCLALQYNWTHPVLIPFTGIHFAPSAEETVSSTTPAILPTDDNEPKYSERKPSSAGVTSERVVKHSRAAWEPAAVHVQIGQVNSEAAAPIGAKPVSQVPASGVVPHTGAGDSSPHRVRFVQVASDVQLEVLDWGGSRRPLVLLAGLGNTAHVFDEFAPKLAAHYHVYGITRRGFGNSSVPGLVDENYSADRLGDDVLEVIDSLGLTRPVLVGHSIAGEELSSIGSRHPEKVSGVVYLDAGYAYAFYDRSRGDLILDSIELRDKLDQLIPGREMQDRKRTYEDLLRVLPRFERELRIHQQETAIIPETTSVDKMPAAAQAIVAGERKYGEIKGPILAIFSCPHNLGSDFAGDPRARAAAEATDAKWTEAQLGAFQAGLPTARVVRLRNASHYVFQSNEADVIREINAFTLSLP